MNILERFIVRPLKLWRARQILRNEGYCPKHLTAHAWCTGGRDPSYICATCKDERQTRAVLKSRRPRLRLIWAIKTLGGTLTTEEEKELQSYL